MIIQVFFILSAMLCTLFVVRVFSIIVRSPVSMPFNLSDGQYTLPSLIFQIWYWTQPLFEVIQ